MSQTQKAKQVASKTMAIKSRVYNQVARFFNKKDDFFKLSDKEKMEKIISIVAEGRWELNDYKSKRKFQKKIQEARIARGLKPKNKTSKAEWEAMQAQRKEVA